MTYLNTAFKHAAFPLTIKILQIFHNTPENATPKTLTIYTMLFLPIIHLLEINIMV